MPVEVVSLVAKAIKMAVEECRETRAFSRRLKKKVTHLETIVLPIFQNNSQISKLESLNTIQEQLMISFIDGIDELRRIVKKFNKYDYEIYRVIKHRKASENLDTVLENMADIESRLLASFQVQINNTVNGIYDVVTSNDKRVEQMAKILDHMNQRFITLQHSIPNDGDSLPYCYDVFDKLVNMVDESDLLNNKTAFQSLMDKLQVPTLYLFYTLTLLTVFML